MISEAAVMSKPSSRITPFAPRPSTPTMIERSVRSFMSITRRHTTLRGGSPARAAGCRWLSTSAARRLCAATPRAGRREVEVDLLHGQDLRPAAAGRAALEPHAGPSEGSRTATIARRPIALRPARARWSSSSCLAVRRRVMAVTRTSRPSPIGEPVEQPDGQLRDVAAVGQQLVGTQANPARDLVNRPQGHRLAMSMSERMGHQTGVRGAARQSCRAGRSAARARCNAGCSSPAGPSCRSRCGCPACPALPTLHRPAR